VDQQAGYFFGVDAFGHIGLQAEVEGVWQSVTSTTQLPLKRWAHIVGTFDASQGLRIYIDGKEVGRLETHGRMNPAFGSDVLIGRVQQPTITYPTYALMYPVFIPWMEFLTSSRFTIGASGPRRGRDLPRRVSAERAHLECAHCCTE